MRRGLGIVGLKKQQDSQIALRIYIAGFKGNECLQLRNGEIGRRSLRYC